MEHAFYCITFSNVCTNQIYITKKKKSKITNRARRMKHGMVLSLKHKSPTLVKHFLKHDEVLKVCNITKGDTDGKRYISSQTE